MDLQRRLNLFDAVSVVVGAVIGTAIFLVPSTVLAVNASPLAAMILVVIGGALSYFGALSYAELGAMMPSTGGEYVYLKESWGKLPAFLCGWSHFLVIQSGGIAAIAAGFAALAASLVPMTPVASKCLASAMLLAFTAVNYTGIRVGASINNVLALCKVGGLVTMVAAIALRSEGATVDWSPPADWALAQFGMALVPILWAYEGWNLVTFTAGEVRNPQRNLPLALAIGLALVIGVYAVSFWVYFQALPVAAIAGSRAVASDAALHVLGPVGGTLVTLTMLVAMAGALNACILAAPRLYYAQARDGLFWRRFVGVHPRFNTPSFALLAQCVWTIALVWSGSYEILLSYCTFGAWIFYALAVSGVIILRRARPDAPRPYRVWGYPWTPSLFAAAAVAFVVSTFVQYPGSSAAGLALIATGIPIYLILERSRRQPAQTVAPPASSPATSDPARYRAGPES